jgi:hypothetical protein
MRDQTLIQGLGKLLVQRLNIPFFSNPSVRKIKSGKNDQHEILANALIILAAMDGARAKPKSPIFQRRPPLKAKDSQRIL